MKFQASYAIACTELVRFSKDTPENPAQWDDSVLYLQLKNIQFDIIENSFLMIPNYPKIQD